MMQIVEGDHPTPQPTTVGCQSEALSISQSSAETLPIVAFISPCLVITDYWLLERFTNGSRPVVDRSASCSRHIRNRISCLDSGVPNMSRCPM